ncbi:MAG: UV DNA damage repair endonuclease UvsE [Pirellulales bacterium]|nr:UV DNA damage repair endonuclease UvsE [Pirellulales bacterium]
MIRLGLCCIFRDQPIKFASTTAAAVGRMSRVDALAKLSRLCLENARSLLLALQFCAEHDIGCFRVNSRILPLKTHPVAGYGIDELPECTAVVDGFRTCAEFAARNSLRICFHPDQFVVLNSHRDAVVEASLRELEYQAEVAQWIGADVINIHAGGAYGDKRSALEAFERNLDRLSGAARTRLTVENDDTIYTPADLLPLCRKAGLPLVYDVHHHRCHGDELSIEQATSEAIDTWNREPLFHISSPLAGWGGSLPRRHHDYIDFDDFPGCWQRLSLTVEVEAKAKELAVLRLRDQLRETRNRLGRRPKMKRLKHEC